MRRAIMDIGSNSVLLLVADGTPGKPGMTIVETTNVSGLGTGVRATGRLSEPGISHTLAALRDGFAVARAHGAESIEAVGTMALRIAQNADEFLAMAQAQGTPVHVISGDEEAELGFLAVANDPQFHHHRRISIVDPGGNSTELVTADRSDDGWAIRFRRSFPIGALALRDGVLAAPSPDFQARLQAVQQLDDAIAMDYLPHQSGFTVVLGATGTNLISIREAMTTWDPERVHGQMLDYEEVSRAVGWLCDMDDAGRAAVPGMERGRERTIHLGALILERFLFALRTPECAVSVRGWRHAWLARLA